MSLVGHASDTYAGYDKLYESGDIIACACWAHARRKFYDITQSVKSPSLVDEALAFIGKLYAIEQETKSIEAIKCYYYRRAHFNYIAVDFKIWNGIIIAQLVIRLGQERI